ncbi:CVNH domain-containing protein [Asticcacaulis sp. W401b]|uniref:CVNH domain-containing protein n=1 Tax=Asticcacaulis sp. W401b TaxID=3388666 RepID=UPI00397089FA
MRRLISLFALTLICGLSAGAASAQDSYGGGRWQDRDDDRRWGGLPSGSYRESCRDIELRGDVLSARCRAKSGYYNYTTLSLRDCRGGSVENDRGNLRCEGGRYGGDWGGNGGGGGGWNDSRLPEGNYLQTCRDIRVEGDRLTARCRMREGGYSYTDIRLRECRGGRVENLNGTLQCEGAGYSGGRLPAGNYRDTCRDISLQGDRLTARCRDKWGDYRLTALSLSDCNGGQVENSNGNLVCRGW